MNLALRASATGLLIAAGFACVVVAVLSDDPSRVRTTPSTIGTGGGAPRTTPAPTVTWRNGGDGDDSGFAVDGLPAIARRGEVVMLELREDDGELHENLRLEVRDRAGRTIEAIPVSTIAELETLAKDTKPPFAHVIAPWLARRIGAANTALERLHRRYDLQPLDQLDIAPTMDDSRPHLAWNSNAGHDTPTFGVDWSGSKLRILEFPSQRLIYEYDGSAWQAPDHEPRADCTYAVSLASAYRAREANAIVIEISYYSAVDGCYVGNGTHVVRW